MRRLAVLIATYKRGAGLERAIRSLGAGTEGVEGEVEIFVCDNDPNGSGRASFERATMTSRWPARYICEPVPGIPAARNALLDASSDADFVAFIDDDEVAQPGWLAALVNAAERFRADIVAGPVIYEFETRPSDIVVSAPCFAVPRQPTGTVARWPRTGNVLVRRSAIDDASLRFRLAYALTGGSDTAFFEELAGRGATSVWSDEAVVVERVPPTRSTVRYIVRRGIRIGNTIAVVERDVRGSPRVTLIRLVKVAGRLVVGAARVAAGGITQRPALISKGLYDIARSWGMAMGLLRRPVVAYPRP